MKTILIQIQSDRLPAFNEAAFMRWIESISFSDVMVDSHEIIAGSDDGRYLNIFLDSKQVSKLWSRLRELLYDDDARFGNDLKNASIATCQGDHGWDDYLLLYHFDQSQKLDTFDR